VVTRYGHAADCERIEIVEAGHPVPDEAGLAAAQRMLGMVRGLQAKDLVLCLLSGGGSSLLPLPLPGISLDEDQQLGRDLLASGATISEINCVRRHLSAIKGGRLAAACYPARVLTLAISDVPGDLPWDIASGPTTPDPTSCADALSILHRYGIPVSSSIRDALESGRGESVKPGDSRLERCEFRLIATPQMVLDAAAAVAEQGGYTPHVLGDAIQGEARDAGSVLAGIALQVANRSQPFTSPCVLISGGETTVTVRGRGRGGRNVEFLLSLGLALGGHERVFAIAGDTDGIDGAEEIAGAVLEPDSLMRSRALGWSPTDVLANNDAHSLFQAIGSSVVTGPTRTNVNDFRAILIA